MRRHYNDARPQPIWTTVLQFRQPIIVISKWLNFLELVPAGCGCPILGFLRAGIFLGLLFLCRMSVPHPLALKESKGRF
jgi:hypothetical protein